MAFYPDELSPIDRIRSLGKQADSLPDLGQLKNRRQWKSLVLGKKDAGMNNFATIAEEKEEEISSDGSRGAASDEGNPGGFPVGARAVANKKITFAKPRKYITSRVSGRKEEVPSGAVGSPVPFASLGTPVKRSSDPEVRAELPDASGGPIADAQETGQLAKAGKSKEFIPPPQDFAQNYAFSETPIEVQWKEAFSEGVGLTGSSRPAPEKPKYDSAQGSKTKHEERRKSSSKPSALTEKRDSKVSKRKGSSQDKKLTKDRGELPSTSATDGKTRQRTEKGKAFNMKDVVNVYKNLAYGSKEEIKSFVENLSFVKDDSKAESDKNLLSMMNLRVLENKIKNFTKKSGKNQESPTPEAKKPKGEKSTRKNRKAHLERLARHKVAKMANVRHVNRQNNEGESTPEERGWTPKGKKAFAKDKEPWKYVGMESVLDKTYFVYPAYPPSANLKSPPKTRKACSKGTGKVTEQKKGNVDAATRKSTRTESKVKSSQVAAKPKSFAGRAAKVSGLGSVSGENRPSATTVCTVKFRPQVGQKTEEPPVGPADQSLLVYLHGTKAIHVKSPYSDKQFSRVKFFRKDEGGMPLIKGLGRRIPTKGSQAVSVRNVSLPGKPVTSLDLLDFDEDIQNIADFLRGQGSPDRRRQEAKKSERVPKESPREQDDAASRHRRRQRRTARDPHPGHPHAPRHPPASRENLSPDSIIDEISKNIQHLQYLPDTEDNRKMIGEFFDELDQRIEASRTLPSPPNPCSHSFSPIPILGY